jgi:hypothetical protein
MLEATVTEHERQRLRLARNVPIASRTKDGKKYNRGP